jgi:hypothetical protein
MAPAKAALMQSPMLPPVSGPSAVRVTGTLLGAFVGGVGGAGLAYATHWHFYPQQCGDCSAPSVGAWPVVGGAIGAGLGGYAMWWILGRFTDAPHDAAR